MSIYCVYLTIYSGNKLPPFYIGSTTVNRIQNENYNGSVSSKMFKSIWASERATSPHLFKTIILKTFKTRDEATEKENKLQKAVNAPNNPLYINRAFASKMAYDEKYNPLKGVASKLKGKKYPKRTGAALENIRAGVKKRRKPSEATKKKISASLKVVFLE